jgi:Ca2+-binding EF-hand superfamily protein
MNIMKKALFIGTIAITGSAFAADYTTLDVDTDGKLSQDEMQEYSRVLEFWQDVDTDSDGFISQNEFEAMVKDESLAERTGWESGETAHPAETADINEEFALLDVNNDNMLSQSEMEVHSGVITHWREIDVNQDDQIDADEFNMMANDVDLSERTGWQSGSRPGPGRTQDK